MATRATETIALAGTAATYNAASGGGDKVAAVDGTILHVKNGGASPIDVTIATPGTVDGLAVADRVVEVPNAGERFIALNKTYRNPADGLASITWESTTSVTFAVVRA